jgi:hypothetical protein
LHIFPASVITHMSRPYLTWCPDAPASPVRTPPCRYSCVLRWRISQTKFRIDWSVGITAEVATHKYNDLTVFSLLEENYYKNTKKNPFVTGHIFPLRRLRESIFLPNAPGFSDEHCFLEGSHASSVCPSRRSNMKTDMKHGWDDTDKRKPKYSEKNLSLRHSDRHKPHTDWPGNEPGPPRWYEAGD